MRDPVEWILVILIAWVGTVLLIHGVEGGHALLTVVGVACCAIAVAVYFVLLLDARDS